MAYWNPVVNATVTIMAATLISVAAIASRMMNFENDCCRLKAIRLAIKAEMFNGVVFVAQK